MVVSSMSGRIQWLVQHHSAGVDRFATRAADQAGIVPVVKQIDTLAAEYPAETNYLWLGSTKERVAVFRWFDNGQ